MEISFFLTAVLKRPLRGSCRRKIFSHFFCLYCPNFIMCSFILFLEYPSTLPRTLINFNYRQVKAPLDTKRGSFFGYCYVLGTYYGGLTDSIFKPFSQHYGLISLTTYIVGVNFNHAAGNYSLTSTLCNSFFRNF